MTFAFFYRASLGGPDERREQKFATLVGDHFGMSPTNILLTLFDITSIFCFDAVVPAAHAQDDGIDLLAAISLAQLRHHRRKIV
ncbi:hypothetical protein EPB69_01970 [Geobacillus stearothermophilus]|nr:hypothetical protein EPB69_01970 [Geobacillus stearothermophilus]